jgi:hypothetical protein
MTNIENLKIGDTLFNHGDMANEQEFIKIIGINKDNPYCYFEVENQKGEKHFISKFIYSPIYLGHGGTRIVAKTEYENFMTQEYKKLKDYIDTLKLKKEI